MTITLVIPRRLSQDVADFAAASAAYQQARDLSGEGASTFPAGIIDRDGVMFATVSYNGRVWSTGQVDGRGSDLLLFDPSRTLPVAPTKNYAGLKPLTFEGRFECGFDAIVKNKVWAFVAVVGDNYGARLGVAIANESGYCPIPEFWANADTIDVMQAHADELNQAEGKSPREAAEIICSTMGGDMRRQCA